MLDLSALFISTAYAQTAAPAAPADGSQTLMSFLPFILILAVFYFLVIRPQQRKFAEQEKMIKALQKGDRVVTSGGIHGKIAKVDEEKVLVLEIADGVQIKIDRDNVVGLEAQPGAKEGEKK